MKLYLWAEPYPVRYGSSMVFAVADNLDEAKLAASRGRAYKYGAHEQEWSPETLKLGDPLRVLDLPCAEWHEWAE